MWLCTQIFTCNTIFLPFFYRFMTLFFVSLSFTHFATLMEETFRFLFSRSDQNPCSFTVEFSTWLKSMKFFARSRASLRPCMFRIFMEVWTKPKTKSICKHCRNFSTNRMLNECSLNVSDFHSYHFNEARQLWKCHAPFRMFSFRTSQPFVQLTRFPIIISWLSSTNVQCDSWKISHWL